MNAQCVLRDDSLDIFDENDVEMLQQLVANYFAHHFKLPIVITKERVKQTLDTVVHYMYPPVGDQQFLFTHPKYSKVDLFNETLGIIIQNMLELYFSEDDRFDPWDPLLHKYMNGTIKLNEKKPKTTIIMRY